ncbi:hypothetical protein, partial [Rhizobium sp. 18065]|uniref:hypothetical protein n=1 Tax=Rhizobium sp. 18065 TaxID=2681411 RepID=UPI001AED2997
GNQSASQPISLDFSRTKVVVASSAAALVSERGYRFHTSNSQQGNFQKTVIFHKPLFLNVFFDAHQDVD